MDIQQPMGFGLGHLKPQRHLSKFNLYSRQKVNPVLFNIRFIPAIKRFWIWIRFGKLRTEVRSVDGGLASEIAYIGRGDKIVGYWAYGYFDPAMPYHEKSKSRK